MILLELGFVNGDDSKLLIVGGKFGNQRRKLNIHRADLIQIVLHLRQSELSVSVPIDHDIIESHPWLKQIDSKA